MGNRNSNSGISGVYLHIDYRQKWWRKSRTKEMTLLTLLLGNEKETDYAEPD